MTDDDPVGLRYAIASNETAIDSPFNSHAAYAGPHLLVIARVQPVAGQVREVIDAAAGELLALIPQVPEDAHGRPALATACPATAVHCCWAACPAWPHVICPPGVSCPVTPAASCDHDADAACWSLPNETSV